MDFAIDANDLGKRYAIGELQKYKALRDTLTNAAYAPFRTVARMFNGHQSSNSGERNSIWAVKNVSFQVKPGEIVALVGRNGAGKSTLLRILSRVTEPTHGHARIRGRIGSLLEVGTGFHPELTGRENVYLNGAILGMTKAEVHRKFDRIVSFAELEKFIDTPVKFYSTGMYIRLAFAVAAHLEPEILLVDEVLAVGDGAFQQKCLTRIRELTDQGTTTVFVSHNMHHVGALATRGIYLRGGSVFRDGDATEVIQLYFDDALRSANAASTADIADASGDNHLVFEVNASNRQGKAELDPGEDLLVTITYRSLPPPEQVHFNVSIWTEQGLLVTSADSRFTTRSGFPASGDGVVRCVFPTLPLATGRYLLKAYILSGDAALASFGWDDGRACTFVIKPKLADVLTDFVWYPTQSDYGLVRVPFKWSSDYDS
jgi:lipopolysaccharide transport system ATP-binding protein